jgi:hypothetical protein
VKHPIPLAKYQTIISTPTFLNSIYQNLVSIYPIKGHIIPPKFNLDVSKFIGSPPHLL